MIRVFILTLIFSLASASFAEQITIGISKQAPEKQNIERPARGMNQEQVIAKFGHPESQTKAKGQPPISTWQYSTFTVYFESDYVIHSVLKHQPKNLPAE